MQAAHSVLAEAELIPSECAVESHWPSLNGRLLQSDEDVLQQKPLHGLD